MIIHHFNYRPQCTQHPLFLITPARIPCSTRYTMFLHHGARLLVLLHHHRMDSSRRCLSNGWLIFASSTLPVRPLVRPSVRHPTTEAALLRSSAGDAAEWHVKSASGHSFEAITDGQDALRGSARKGTKEATPAF